MPHSANPSSRNARSSTTNQGVHSGRIKRNIVLTAVGLLTLGGIALYASRPGAAGRVNQSTAIEPATAQSPVQGLAGGSGAVRSGESPTSFPRPTVPRGTNVLLITLDSVRKDYIGCYGGQWVPTPNIDALAAAGLRYDDAVTAAPITAPSHASILTGWYPANHTLRDDGPYGLPDAIETLPEALASNGYATAAFIGSALLQSRLGFGQGFNHFDENLPQRKPVPFAVETLPQRSADKTVSAAIAWLDGHLADSASKPFFAWVNLSDARWPYTPPEPHATKHSVRPYAGEIAFIDEQIGRLTGHLKEKNLLDKTLIVLVGAHGEGLGDHNELYHGLLLYEPTVTVPLILAGPGLPGAPRFIGSVASTVDVAPTILGLLNIPGERKFSGQNLLFPSAAGERIVYIETLAPLLRHGWAPIYSFRGTRTKYIESAAVEMYRPSDDPKEVFELFQIGQADRETTRAGMKEQQVQAFGNRIQGNPSDSTIAKETIDQIVERGHKADLPARLAPGKEPRRMVHFSDHYRRAFDRLRQGAAVDAAHQFRYLLEQSPHDATLHSGLAKALAESGELVVAADSALRAALLQPRERHWLTLASIFIRLRDWGCVDPALEQMRRVDPGNGETALLIAMREIAGMRFDDADKWLDEAIRLDPVRHLADAHAARGELLALREQPDEARQAFEKALAVDPEQLSALRGMAALEAKAGRLDAQAGYLKRLMDCRPAVINTANDLARLYIENGRETEGIQIMRTYVERNPGDMAGLGNLGNVYQDSGHLEESIVYYRKALEISPDYLFAHYNLGNALLKLSDFDQAAAEFRTVLRIHPKHPKAPARLLAALTLGGKPDEAFATLEELARDGRINWEELASDVNVAPLVGNPRFGEIRAKYGAK